MEQYPLQAYQCSYYKQCCASEHVLECRYASPKILDQLLAGEGSICLQDWQSNTLYKHCSAEDTHIQWFWSLLRDMDQPQLQALLAFVTCTPVPPVGGLLLPQNTDSKH